MCIPHNQYESLQPPKLLRVRYRTIFLLLQIVNAIRYYICPDELNVKFPTLANLTLVCILVPNALAFLHGLDGNKKNWEVVQSLMLITMTIFLINVAIAIYLSTHTVPHSEECWRHIWDQAIYWNEIFIAMAMYYIAKAEARYFLSVECLDKTAAEYGCSKDATKKKKKKAVTKEPEDPTKYSKIRTFRY